MLRFVLQRSFRRSRQLFSVAMALFAEATDLAWVLLWRRFHRLRRRPPKGHPDRPVGSLIRLVPQHEVRVGGSCDDPVLTRRGEVVSRSGQGW